MTLRDCDVMYINVVTRGTAKKIIKRNIFQNVIDKRNAKNMFK